MSIESKYIHETNPYRKIGLSTTNNRTIYYGEVISIDDATEGGRIKVRILDLDNNIGNADLPYSYPYLPKFFHIYPKVGEMVRVMLEDIDYPQRSRFWIGSIISQLPKINYDGIYTALSTTNMGITSPEKATKTYSDAKGIYPNIDDIAILGRVNTDIILKENGIEIRAGKHENDNVLKLNKKNPASIKLTFQKNQSGDFNSYNILMADKIALISHDGDPKFKASDLNDQDRENIMSKGHPIGRGDVIAEILEVFRKAIITHVHGYSNTSTDRSDIIDRLQKLDLNSILQKNIVTN